MKNLLIFLILNFFITSHLNSIVEKPRVEGPYSDNPSYTGKSCEEDSDCSSIKDSFCWENHCFCYWKNEKTPRDWNSKTRKCEPE